MIEISHSSTDTTKKVNRQDHGAIIKKKPSKSTHVPTACINCKKAHLACDLSRPCKRCSSLGKCDTCIDIKHKKRGRPKLTASKKWSSSANKANKMESNSSSMPLVSTTTSNNFISLLPLTAPGLSSCSFKLTNNNNNTTNATAITQPKSEMMTIFLSMDLCCARVSDESIDYLQKHPKNIDYCSFYDLIHSDSSDTLSCIHRLLLDNSHSHRKQQPISFTTSASSNLFRTSSPAQLFQIANGSQTLRETLKFKLTGKTMSCRFYLGGGFGADLFRPETLHQLYMVCIATDITNSSNATSPSPPISNDHQFINALLFDGDNKQQQQQLDSLLNSSDELMSSMYNTTASSNNNQEAIQLVDRLCQSMMIPPSTPPEPMYDYYNSSSSSDSSIEGNNSSRPLDHETTSNDIYTPPDTSYTNVNTLLDNNTMFMLSSPSTKEMWGYDIYAPLM